MSGFFTHPSVLLGLANSWTQPQTLPDGTVSAASIAVATAFRLNVAGANKLDYNVTNAGAWTLTGGLYASSFIFASGNYLASDGALLNFGARASVRASASGVVVLENAAADGFDSLILGVSGTTFNRIKHNAAGVLELRLANDSAQATWDALAYRVAGTKVVGAQGASIADASGGVTQDAEARTALNALLARVRTHGLIAT